MPVMTPAVPVVVDERAARRDLRDQIARLERELARTLAAAFPRREPARSGRSASAQAGPRLLTLGQLECIRDELADRVETLRSNRGAELLEQMRLAPERHRWETVTSADLGEPGCHVWQVRPRLGPHRHADGVVAREDLLRLPVSRLTPARRARLVPVACAG